MAGAQQAWRVKTTWHHVVILQETVLMRKLAAEGTLTPPLSFLPLDAVIRQKGEAKGRFGGIIAAPRAAAFVAVPGVRRCCRGLALSASVTRQRCVTAAQQTWRGCTPCGGQARACIGSAVETWREADALAHGWAMHAVATGGSGTWKDSQGLALLLGKGLGHKGQRMDRAQGAKNG
eukprot:350283-Chlamydomonas_euryale.AAC.1